MPKLELGKVYEAHEVEKYTIQPDGTNDYNLAIGSFPHDLSDKDLACNNQAFQPGEKVLLKYLVLDLADFRTEIEQLSTIFRRQPAHWERVTKIVKVLTDGHTFHPVFVQRDAIRKRILEGMHRAVALLEMGSQVLPTFILGYRNWLQSVGPPPGFEQEDKIASCSYQEAGNFCWTAKATDQRGADIALLNLQSLSKCNVILAATYQEKIIGIASLKTSPDPSLETVYVLRQYRRHGVGNRLATQALQLLKQKGVMKVGCDIQSPEMWEVLVKIAKAEPDLANLVKDNIRQKPTEGVEVPEFLDDE
jgi:hypothetical protein